MFKCYYFINLDRAVVITYKNKGLTRSVNTEVAKTKRIDMVGLILKKEYF